jgi:hypothetical protein
MKQTAVEWLVDELILEGINVPKVFYDKAKEMEKEQMRIHSIDEELFKRLPIEGTNFCSFNVKEFRYFATKYYIDNFKETYESNTRI